jgi:hypothetical protein
VEDEHLSSTWESEEVQPKPYMNYVCVLKYFTTEQLKWYKLVLFLKLLVKKESYKVVKRLELNFN